VTDIGGRTQTLHQRILNDVGGKIVSGQWPPGHRLPFEVDLAAQYGCSRMTVNKVMTQLAKSGLIERRKKSGSFVTRPQAQSAVLEIADIEQEVRSLNLRYAFRLERRQVRGATQADLRALETKQAKDVLALLCIHFAGERPFCVEDRIINLAAVPDAMAEDFSATPPGRWLLGEIPWSAAEHRIHATAATPEMAAMLGVAKGCPCLLIERRTWSDAGTITYVRLTYPGETHSLVARFTPASR